MAKRVSIRVSIRNKTGTRESNRLRRANLIPGIIYGKRKKPTPVVIDRKELHKEGLHFVENILVDLVIQQNGKETKKTVLIKEIQRDPIKDDLLHVDFNEISLKQKIRARVPVILTGEAAGVTQGGILEQLLHEIEIEALPADLPEHLEVDVKDLSLGQTWHIGDIPFPGRISILEDPSTPVVTVVTPKAAEEEEEVTAEEIEEPEVVKKGKKEEVEEEGE